MRKTKVHKVVLLVVDHDDIGADEVEVVIENNRYPNHCIAPGVMDIQTLEVTWTDDHPLNRTDTRLEEFARMFGLDWIIDKGKRVR